MKKLLLPLLVVVFLAFAVTAVKAGDPDEFGPWADTVISADQANTKGGQPVSTVNPDRSNPMSALGVAEADTADSHFFSLGFGGMLTLGFDNGISSGAFVVESTNPDYPVEKAQVEVSQDGSTWYLAGTVNQDGSVPLPSQVSCGKFVRITDISNPDDFSESTADAYDVDGVRAEGLSCSTTGRMKGKGYIFTVDESRVKYDLDLRCNPPDSKQKLKIKWDEDNKFHLESLTSALCTDDPAVDQGHPKSTFDTHKGQGIGTFNDTPGYKIEWSFVDAGEPGKNDDTADIVIKDPSNVIILSVSGVIHKGNNQAKK